MASVGTEPLARHALAYVLAGGRGSRLLELTDRRAKPAVYFGGKSRIIDFALSNALNSGIRRIARRHAIQGPQPDPPPADGLELLPPGTQRELRYPAGQPAHLRDQLVSRHGGRGLSEHRHPRDLRRQVHRGARRRPHLQDGLRAHAAAARRAGRGCDGRLPRSAARGSERLSASCMSTTTTRSGRFSRSRPIRRRCPASPTNRSPAWASMSSTPNFLFDELRRDAADPNSSHDFGKDIIPYIVKNGRAVAHHFTRSCVRSQAMSRTAIGAMSERVDAYWAANIDLTDVVPELDLYDRAWPIWTHGEITPPAKFVHDEEGRRGEAITSLVSGGCIVSGAAVRRSLLFTGVHVALLRQDRERGHAALCRCRAQCAADATSSSTAACKFRKDWSWAKTPSSTPKRFRTHRAGHLPHHAADDRQTECMTPIRVLSVASEIYPLVKTGGLADVAGALPGCAEGGGRRNPDFGAGISGCASKRSGRRRKCFVPSDFLAAPRACSADRAASSICFVLDAPHLFARSGNPYLGPDGSDWPDNGLRFAALARMAADIGQGAISSFVPEVVHAHDWQAGLTPAYLKYSDRPASRHRHDCSQSGLSGDLSGGHAKRDRPAAGIVHAARRRILWRRSDF